MLQRATFGLRVSLTGLALAAIARPAALAQGEGAEWCDERRDRERGWFCEVREQTLAADRDVIRVDSDPNGGIKVFGWDRNEILLRARVAAGAWTDDEAAEIASAVRVLTDGATIAAEGPRMQRREWWSVSYEIFVPHRSNLSLETTNGGITISDVMGDLDFRTVNGGARLLGVAGDVRGRVTNGGLHIELTGTEWQGEGMDVEATNGGVQIEVPENYNARLETGTVNGGMTFDFPITVQGRFGRRLTVDLGNGGRLIKAVTTNGGVKLKRGE